MVTISDIPDRYNLKDHNANMPLKPLLPNVSSTKRENTIQCRNELWDQDFFLNWFI